MRRFCDGGDDESVEVLVGVEVVTMWREKEDEREKYGRRKKEI